jgi:hypothetical protein
MKRLLSNKCSSRFSRMAGNPTADARSDGMGGTMSEMAIAKTNERPGGGAGAAVATGPMLDLELALADLAAGIRTANAEVRRMFAASAGWTARGAWATDHPSVRPG